MVVDEGNLVPPGRRSRADVSSNLGGTSVGDTPDLPDRRGDGFVEARPWGQFQSFVTNETVTVKIITVAPGQRLSLQRHAQRAEMWQVLDDTPLEISVGERTWTAGLGEQIWIPVGATHRLGNRGDQPGRILEVGFGFFDEDDIERLEDDYARE
ncbi:MAG: phosphomannose isomerase type II C-terminal cupin domain [Austwickia sp.]|jgi:mannose-6-phosphate isomerase|nr:phosphomannose isomerase type II C-terminal cupin domain [Austwickia sp.]MBK8436372.1 phosphomannose isomerase type II C-terminal cupin domain [Austwickia sp.]MBK9102048.1 phosphomannose isomerase type II C-terminal cupin domain [Austwickia sp.]